MKKLYFLLFLFVTTLSFGQATDLYFSMYGEGSSNNKFIEIYNGTGSDVDLGDYSVELYSNGAATATNTLTFTAGTMLTAGDVYVAYNGSANATIVSAGDASSSVCNFNGDDALALLKLGSVIDVIGQIGTDPGASWAVGSTPDGTVNHTIIRKSSVCSPNPVNLASFGTDDTNSEWTVYPSDDQWGQIGTHNGCSSSPSLVISSPTDGTTFNPLTTSVDVTLSINNFVVANGTGDGHIHYTINGGSVVMKYDTTPISVPVTAGNSYTVYVELVDNSHNPIAPAVNATVNFDVAAYNVVATIADVRNDVITNGAGRYYQITGEALVTYTRPATRNQKYIQDATAGILIDDNTNIITNTFNIGDGMTGLRGQTSLFNGVLQFLPVEDITVSSTGNTITPQVVTVADITGNIEAYESELVKINGVTFTDGNGSNTFAINTNYDITDTNTMVFRSMFGEADYVVNSDLIPTGPTDIIVLVAEFNGTAQVVARSLADVTLSTNSFNAIDGLVMYPNPVSGNNLFFTSTNNGEMNVQIFDILGKEVIKANVINNQVNVSGLNAGVYIVKVTEAGKTATRKLVVK
ncbi:T9SS type A sorting domain-containing protein [Flavobacterium haoranii]|uniref:Por secretion system C-terminal sorting domain-containing protein n=1 Tax=Flavobacterium haoranii TaxID=683124 RepID=A0A1M6FC90_9FLAO|nr:T9SS type A sorting domain-containing protein [Flavobacterium haoranii]SHI95374.1 Por secretion system C-terminal sorting domain-containing protein [Flavobacterium haoranii]